MKSSIAENLFLQIETTIINVDGFSIATPLEKSYLAKYLVVFICGIYEEIIENIIKEMVGKMGNQYLDNFFDNYLETFFRNPCIKNISKLLKNFNKDWSCTLNGLPQVNRLALDSIITDKNSLAHGGASTITIGDVKQYYLDSKLVIETIDEMLL